MADRPLRSVAASALEPYSVRIMLGWVGSLLLLLVLTHLPLSTPADRVGWHVRHSDEQISLSAIHSPEREESTPSVDGAPPPTRMDRRAAEPEKPEEAREPEPQPTASALDSTERNDSSPTQHVSTLEATDDAPNIIGGSGALYLHIAYPKAARDQGIEGTLMLEFTVTTEGKATAVEVVESLHPLCDSSAVAGVKSVRFAPAKHNGTPVPVRMRLPIRFRLLSAARSPSLE